MPLLLKRNKRNSADFSSSSNSDDLISRYSFLIFCSVKLDGRPFLSAEYYLSFWIIRDEIYGWESWYFRITSAVFLNEPAESKWFDRYLAISPELMKVVPSCDIFEMSWTSFWAKNSIKFWIGSSFVYGSINVFVPTFSTRYPKRAFISTRASRSPKTSWNSPELWSLLLANIM